VRRASASALLPRWGTGSASVWGLRLKCRRGERPPAALHWLCFAPAHQGNLEEQDLHDFLGGGLGRTAEEELSKKSQKCDEMDI
jgi:hypothetical protein